jgi:hypothetical protein
MLSIISWEFRRFSAWIEASSQQNDQKTPSKHGMVVSTLLLQPIHIGAFEEKRWLAFVIWFRMLTHLRGPGEWDITRGRQGCVSTGCAAERPGFPIALLGNRTMVKTPDSRLEQMEWECNSVCKSFRWVDKVINGRGWSNIEIGTKILRPRGFDCIRIE